MKPLLTRLLAFLKGSLAHVGTTKNLLREITVGAITAVVIALTVQFISRLFEKPEPNPVHELREVLNTTVANQRRADSVEAVLERQPLLLTIDSLNNVVDELKERDSLRTNAGLSSLDAARKINRAIEAGHAWPGRLRHSARRGN